MVNRIPSRKEGALRYVVTGGYSPTNAKFDEVAYEKNWHIPFLIVFGFLRRYSLREFHLVHGDPMIAMVASEIWLYNVSRTLVRDGGVNSMELLEDEVRRKRLPRCNAYSISQYLGVPSQTVRRKVQRLIEMGWVEKSDTGQLMTTKACEDEFNTYSDTETMRDFISTARTLFTEMGLDLAPDLSSPRSTKAAAPSPPPRARKRVGRIPRAAE